MHHFHDVITVRHNLCSIKKNTHYSLGLAGDIKGSKQEGRLQNFYLLAVLGMMVSKMMCDCKSAVHFATSGLWCDEQSF